MYQTKIAQASGRYATDIYGASLYNIGNNMLHPGDYVMTDGQCIYGRHRNQGIPEISTVDIYPFYNPNCAAQAIFSAGSAGTLCGMSNSGYENKLATNIRQNDGYNNFCVAGRNVVYFVQASDHGYMAYNLSTGASFAINSEKITSGVLDACVDSDGNLLTAFRRRSDDVGSNSGNGVLVFRNDSILHEDQAMSGGVYKETEHGYVPRFLHLRQDGTYIGVFGYCSYYCESDADLPSTSISIIDVPVNIQEYSFNSGRLGDITIYQEWDNVMLPFFPELKDVSCKVETSLGGYSHWRAIRYDSRSNEKTEIMHIVAHAGDSVGYIIDTGKTPLHVKYHEYDDPKKKHNDEDEHTDKDEIYYSVNFADEPYRSNALPAGPNTYSVEGSKEFSIPIGDEDAYELAFERLSVADCLTVERLPTLTDGQMGFMHPIWTSGVSILGLKENIGQAKIIDVKKAAGGYLILTSDGVYESDGTTARMLCRDFKCWNNNFRLNRVSRSSQSWSIP